MKYLDQYMEAFKRNDVEACLRIEERHGLDGYPPDLVTVGLRAVDEGRDAQEAVDNWIAERG